MRLAPFGRELASRLKFGNPPFHVVVCVGLDAWPRAKGWNACPNDVAAMVLPDGVDPRAYVWPVRDQLVVVEAGCGPSDDDLRDLSAVLLAYGANMVTITSRDGLNKFHQYIAEVGEDAA
jgi:hypothetical protein